MILNRTHGISQVLIFYLSNLNTSLPTAFCDVHNCLSARLLVGMVGLLDRRRPPPSPPQAAAAAATAVVKAAGPRGAQPPTMMMGTEYLRPLLPSGGGDG